MPKMTKIEQILLKWHKSQTLVHRFLKRTLSCGQRGKCLAAEDEL